MRSSELFTVVTSDMTPVDRFFTFSREREKIRLLKDAGHEQPWTEDVILNHYRFCNIHRENDRVTRWFRENVRDPMKDDAGVVRATFIFRWFNRITTAERMLAANLFADWNLHKAREVLYGINPIVTGAYMIKTPSNLTKLEGIIAVVEQFIDMGVEDRIWHDCKTLESAWNVLCNVPYMGGFYSYEVVTDLRWTRCLQDAEDINTWANPGPGAMRGLDRINGDPLGTRAKKIAHYWDEMQEHMRTLLEFSRDPKLWPKDYQPWELREVEHTLCEFDKYERARLGEGKPKKKYRAGEPS